MLVNLPYFLLAVLLLLFPRAWLRHGPIFKRRRRSGEKTRIVEPWRTTEVGDPHVTFRHELSQFRNYLDLLRAAVGSVLFSVVIGLAPCLSAPAGAPPSVSKKIMMVQWAIFLAGLLIQTVRIERQRVTFFAPIFYLAGLSIGLCGLTAGLFAFVLVWAFSPAMGNAQAFLTVYAGLIVVFAYFFGRGGNLSALYAGGLCFLPVLLSLLGKRPLLVPARKGSRPGRG